MDIKGLVGGIRGTNEQGDQFYKLAKILSIKDQVLEQILSGMLYKKMVVWKDLKISLGSSQDDNVVYAKEKVVEVHQKIENFQQTLDYLPSRFDFKPVDPDEEGEYLRGDVQSKTEFIKILEAVVESNGEMETLIKDKFLFSKEKIQGFLDTNPVQATLREKVEEL